VIIINLLFYCIAICCFIFSLLGSRHCSYIWASGNVFISTSESFFEKDTCKLVRFLS
jgi:hypothetical protein